MSLAGAVARSRHHAGYRTTGGRPRERMPSIVPRLSTKLLFSTGDSLEVEGSIEDVEKPLQNAARSSPGTLAWLKDADSGESVCVNPVHVVTLTPVTGVPTPPT
jgi:hypothetical protein